MVDMCCSQPVRVDHMCKKRRAGGRNFFLQRVSLEHPTAPNKQSLVVAQPWPYQTAA
jgi:hypothetical protein